MALEMKYNEEDQTPYGVLTTGGAFALTASTFDFDAFKLSFHNAIAAYTDLIGGWDIDLKLTDNDNGTATLAAVITFDNMTDACYFASLWLGEDLPDMCAVYQPLAKPEDLIFS